MPGDEAAAVMSASAKFQSHNSRKITQFGKNLASSKDLPQLKIFFLTNHPLEAMSSVVALWSPAQGICLYDVVFG